MEDKTLKTLEFDKILDQLAGYAGSEPGKELCRRLRPSSNFRHIARWQKNTRDACSRIRLSGGSISFRGVRDIGEVLKRLEIGAALPAAELLCISSILSIADRAWRFGASWEGPEDSLSEMFSMLEPLTGINRHIQNAIIDEDTIADDASPGLADIRQRIKKTESDMHDTMAAKLNSNREYLTDAVITMRDGRYCLPVKAEFKSKVPGMVHDISSTGMTLFIEPVAAVSLNNGLRELRAEELREIEKVLRGLSSELMPYADTIHDDIKILTRLDMIFAKALFSSDLGGTEPEFSKNRSICLREARHPLIEKDRAVPINIELGRTFDLLIITGPNTGGKTVALKTCGLLTVMAQSGLHIPAAEGSVMGIFDDVYADIGDEQSIEQSLSTFSSHMTNTVHILKKADVRSLCLFDELGSGTDPTEGAALGMAILDFLHNKKIRTMATTHYAELKVYALETEGVENACCEFDTETLKPTYRLLTGVPGRSNAFAISERLGLPRDIIEEAGLRINTENKKFEDVIKRLNEDRIGAEKAREEADKYKAEAKQLRDRLKLREEKIEASREKILSEARREAQRILKNAKETADSTLKNINQLKSVQDYTRAEKEREKLRKSLRDTSEGGKLSEKGPSRPVSPKKLKIGDTVRVMPMGGVSASVTSLPDRDNNIFVQIGFMKSKVNVRDIEMDDSPSSASGEKTPGEKNSGFSGRGGSAESSFDPGAMSISPEINLIGMTTDEAYYVMEKYLDDAYMAHLDQVRIVHGRGTGALKNMVHQRLKKISYVDSFRLGVFGEGDTGVTIVKFR